MCAEEHGRGPLAVAGVVVERHRVAPFWRFARRALSALLLLLLLLLLSEVWFGQSVTSRESMEALLVSERPAVRLVSGLPPRLSVRFRRWRGHGSSALGTS